MKTLQKLLSVLLIFNALVLSAQQMTFTGKVLGPDGATLPGYRSWSRARPTGLSLMLTATSP